MKMQTRDLDYFIKLSELNNLTQVAQFFSVSQPTITYAVKRLEDQLGTDLIVRDTEHHAIRITTAGTQFLVHARRIVNELSRAKSEAENAKQGKIRLGLPPIIGSYYFSTYIPALAKANLISQLETESFGSQETMAHLLAGQINLALFASSQPLMVPDLTLFELAQWPFQIITTSRKMKDPLPERVSFAQAAQKPFVVFDEGFVHNRVFDYFSGSSDIIPNIIYRTSDLDILKNMVSHNAGIALLTSLAIGTHDALKAHEMTDPNQPKFRVYLAYRRGYLLSADEKRFVNIFN